MQQQFYLRVCSSTIRDGDRIGVYLFSDNLEHNDLLDIINQNTYNKTAFISTSQNYDFKIDFYDGQDEIDLCGNSIIASFSLLRDQNIIKPGLHFVETICGVLPVIINEDMVYIEQPEPKIISEVNSDEISNYLKNYTPHETLKPLIIKNIRKELFLPVKSQKDLYAISLLNNHVVNFFNMYDIEGIHVFCLGDKVDAHSRSFIPMSELYEEHTCVFSSGSLAYYLYNNVEKKKKYTFKQGRTIDQSSEIHSVINTTSHRFDSIWVGGNAYVLNEKHYSF